MLRDFSVCRSVALSVILSGFTLSVCQAQAAPGEGSSAPAATSTTSKTADVPPNQVILKVGDKQVTAEQFQQYLADLEAMQGPADLSRKQLGESYASMLLLAQQAVANHLDTDPQVIRQLAIYRLQILSNAEFAKLKAEAHPTPEQVSQYYNSHLDDYDVVNVRRIFIFKKGPGHEKGVDPAEAKPLAEQIKQAYASGQNPRKLIKDPEAVVLDDKPLTFQRGEMPAQMEKVAFAMNKPGEWTVLDDAPDTLVMLQLVSRSRRSLADMTPEIEKKLDARQLREELEEMKKNNAIWMDESYFASKAPVSTRNAEPEAPGQSKTNEERGER